MSLPVTESQNFKNITSTTTLKTGPGGILGIFVSSASSTPTITVSDGSTTLVAQFTPVAATFYPMPGRFNTSLVVTISGTVSCTVFWD
jgi:hypothetical protein